MALIVAFSALFSSSLVNHTVAEKNQTGKNCGVITVTYMSAVKFSAKVASEIQF